MKKILILVVCFGFLANITFAQNTNRAQDSLLNIKAAQFFTKGLKYRQANNYDSSTANFKNAGNLYTKTKSFNKYWDILNEIANNHIATEKYSEAEQLLKTIIKSNEKRRNGKNKQVADAYYSLGLTYFRTEDYIQQISSLQKSLEIRILLYKGDHLIVANTQTFIGIGHSKKRDFQTALDYFLEALRIREKKLRNENAILATSFGNVASMYKELRNYDLAIDYFLKELEIVKKSTMGEHLLWASSYNSIANGFFLKGDYENAQEYFQKALRTHSKLLGGEVNANVANDYNNIGACMNSMGKHEQALNSFFRALEIRKKIFGDRHIEIAQLYNNIGVSYSSKKNNEKAIEYHSIALEMRRALLGEKNVAVANSYNNIGSAYHSKGDYNLALENLNKAAEIWKSLLGEKNTEIATSYSNLGSSYAQKGEYDKALEYYNKALNLRKELFGNVHPEIATSYNNIGITHYLIGEYDKALNYYSNSLDMRKELFGEKHPDVATSYNNLGVTHYFKENYPLALDHYETALRIKIDLLGEHHTDLAQPYQNIGAIYFDMGQHEQAVEFYNKALDLQIRQLSNKHPYVASTYNNLANSHFRTGRYDSALREFHESLIANVINFNDTSVMSVPTIANYSDHNRLFNSLVGKSESLLRLHGKNSIDNLYLPAGYAHLLAADSLIDKTRNLFSSEADKIRLANNVGKLTEVALNICKQLYNQTADANYLEKAFYFLEKSKSVVLLSSIAAKNFTGVSDSLLKVEQGFNRQISILEQRLAEEKSLESAGDAEKLHFLQNQLFQLNRKYDLLTEEFKQKYPDYYQLKYDVKITSVKEFQNVILAKNPKAALINYFIGENKSIYISILTKNKLDLLILPPDVDLEKQIRGLRNSITFKVDNSYLAFGHNLYQSLLKPIQEHFKNTRQRIDQLMIVNDGILAYIPFEALLTKEVTYKKKEKLKYQKLPYLIKNYNISYGLSATILMQKFQEKDFADSAMIAFAPIFDEAETALISKDENEFYEATQKVGESTGIFSNNGKFVSPLPATKEEVENIANLFAKKKSYAKTFVGLKANEENFKERVGNFRYIHLATHGLVNETQPKLSGLLLAQDTDEKENGLLYAGELYNIKLNADLVVLSACETGLGKVVRGEGIIGMTRGFLYAGAKNVIVSLWKVSDNSTAELMTQFYTKMLDNNSKAEALRFAKLKMIKSKNYDKPYFWSPFVLIGQ